MRVLECVHAHVCYVRVSLCVCMCVCCCYFTQRSCCQVAFYMCCTCRKCAAFSLVREAARRREQRSVQRLAALPNAMNNCDRLAVEGTAIVAPRRLSDHLGRERWEEEGLEDKAVTC